MSTLTIRNASLLVTMDDKRREIPDGGMVIRNGVIEAVGSTSDLPSVKGKVIDLRGHIVLPGLVNTHHHMYQTLTRVLPDAQNTNLFKWLKVLYPIWARLTPEAIYISSLVAMAELLQSGCTTTSDHLYLFPNGSQLDNSIQAAQEIGIRFHAARGSMSLGESKGGLPPDKLVEDLDAILTDSMRVIETYHDSKRGAMLRIVLAPCSPFSVTRDLMRETLSMARTYDVQLHTHLAETRDEQDYCQDKFGQQPLSYVEDLGWSGSDIWFAHMVHVSAPDIAIVARNGCGVSHCPSSNMRLASGIAPVQLYRESGVNLGLGVDGSSSNDSSHMLAEARMATLMARLAQAPGLASRRDTPMMTARESLEIATVGGAAVLQRNDIGSLSAGKCADLFAIDLNRLDYAGALHDPLAATVLCAPQKADLVIVNGRILVQDGCLLTPELGPLINRHNQIAQTMINAT